MSCHDIGRGMASVGREVLRLYDEQKFDIDTAKQLLWATIRGVNWCDGNGYEAAGSLECRCANCLKKVSSPKDELIFGSRYFAEVSGIAREEFPIEEEDQQIEKLYMKDVLMAPQVCRKCYQVLVTADP